MKNPFHSCLCAVVLALGFCQAPAEAISLSFQPAAPTVAVGGPFNVDVVISGLNAAGEIASAFDLDVTYDPAILTGTNVYFGVLLGDPVLSEADAGAVLTPGRIDFWTLSYLSDGDLALIQPGHPDSFVLATLAFQAIGGGTSALRFDPVTFPGVDVKGNLGVRLDVGTVNGSVTVTGGVHAVPEPSSLWLFAPWLGAWAGRIPKKSRRR